MKRINRLLAATVVLTTVVTPVGTFAATNDGGSKVIASQTTGTGFADLSTADTWAQESIVKAKAIGLMAGDPSGAFRPHATISRQELAVILTKALKLDAPAVSGSSFTDVTAAAWGRNYIEAVNKAGIMLGDGKGNFRPDEPISREELAVVLVKSTGISVEGKGQKLAVADKTSVSNWASDYVQAAIELGLMKGDGVHFNPQSHATRQEIAIVAVNFTGVLAQMTQTPAIDSVADGSVTIQGTSYQVSDQVKGILNAKNADVLKGAKVKFEVANGTLNKITYLEITNSGKAAATGGKEFSGDLVLDGNNGTIDGDVKVSADFISINNLTVKGDFVIGQELANDFYSNNLTVVGKTVVNGGASNTVVFDHAVLGAVNVNKTDVRVEPVGSTTLGEVTVSSNATITSEPGVTIPKLTVLDGVDHVEINANVTTVNLADQHTKLTIQPGSKVDNLVLPEGTKASDVIANYDQVKEQIQNVNGSQNPDVPVVTGGGVTYAADLNGASLTDVTGVGTDGQVKLHLPEANANDSFAYKVFDDAQLKPKLNTVITIDKAGYTAAVDGDTVDAAEGQHVVVVEIDGAGKVKKFVDLTSNAAIEPLLSGQTLTIWDQNDDEVFTQGDQTYLAGTIEQYNVNFVPGVTLGEFSSAKVDFFVGDDLVGTNTVKADAITANADAQGLTGLITAGPNAADSTSDSFWDVGVYSSDKKPTKAVFTLVRNGVTYTETANFTPASVQIPGLISDPTMGVWDQNATTEYLGYKAGSILQYNINFKQGYQLSDFSCAKVDFYAGNTKVGTNTVKPDAFSANEKAAGLTGLITAGPSEADPDSDPFWNVGAYSSDLKPTKAIFTLVKDGVTYTATATYTPEQIPDLITDPTLVVWDLNATDPYQGYEPGSILQYNVNFKQGVTLGDFTSAKVDFYVEDELVGTNKVKADALSANASAAGLTGLITAGPSDADPVNDPTWDVGAYTSDKKPTKAVFTLVKDGVAYTVTATFSK